MKTTPTLLLGIFVALSSLSTALEAQNTTADAASSSSVVAAAPLASDDPIYCNTTSGGQGSYFFASAFSGSCTHGPLTTGATFCVGKKVTSAGLPTSATGACGADEYCNQNACVALPSGAKKSTTTVPFVSGGKTYQIVVDAYTTAAPQRPLAQIEAPSTVAEGASIILQGGNSKSFNDGTLTYQWTASGDPNNKPVLSSATTVNTYLTVPFEGAIVPLTVTLTVTDSSIKSPNPNTGTATIKIPVKGSNLQLASACPGTTQFTDPSETQFCRYECQDNSGIVQYINCSACSTGDSACKKFASNDCALYGYFYKSHKASGNPSSCGYP